ncbi:MAG TPA: hypothetical protein EYQ14_20275 [Gammaproteobacteria bacterium]|nr:hypothetical protein [Gammaproteobacteria bacterium]
MRSTTAVVLILISYSSVAAEQVPFGNSLGTQIINYHRHRPMIATSGYIAPGAFGELKKHGFKTVLDLRTEAEGVREEAKIAEQAGLVYHNIPIGKEWPTDNVFRRFKELVENPDNLPILIHCASANRVGMVWAEYEIRNGKDFDAAIVEGRTIGMREARETQLIKSHSRLSE